MTDTPPEQPVPTTVELRVGPTNGNPVHIADAGRRLCDLLGKPGIKAKTGQTNDVFAKTGVLNLTFSSASHAEKYVSIVQESGHPALEVNIKKPSASLSTEDEG
jgi:hypothetical protein